MEGVLVGARFLNRQEPHHADVHLPLLGGIPGGSDRADSMALSGGYIDDADHGDVII